MTTLDRNTLRTTLRQKRNNLTSEQQKQAAQQLLQTFKQAEQDLLTTFSTNHQSTLKMALYLAHDGEISPDVLCQYFWQHEVVTYLPTIYGETLKFAEYTQTSKWKKNRFGIEEPIDERPKQGIDMDIVFLPLVGFDTTGGRLGMGGGFYDKTFANKKLQQPPLLIGLAHDCQQLDKLPLASWDVPLDGIITNTQFISQV